MSERLPGLYLVVDSDGSHMDIDCGVVQSLSDNIHVSTARVPIVTYTAENAFLFDTGTTDSFSAQIIRKNPIAGENGITEVINDSTVLESADWGDTRSWSNRVWKEALTKFINRWQARTDGCRMIYVPVVQDPRGYQGGDVFQRSIDVNVYIKSISFSYSTTSAEVIKATLEFTVGSMCGKQQVRW